MESQLLRKPTNRVPHTGGELIQVGTEDEQLLVSWIRHLAAIEPVQAGPAPEATERSFEVVRRLTHVQYDNTVHALLGDRSRPSRSFPSEDYVNGYTNQTSAQTITPTLAEAYGKSAERLARTAFRYGDENGLIPCEPTGPSDRACAESFVRVFGSRAYRRSLEPAEIDSLTALLLAWARPSENFLKGAEIVVETLLQSPHFLYIAPNRSASHSAHNTAARLSYALQNAPPDKPLVEAARSGRLEGFEDVVAEGRRLLASTPARATFDEFFEQWMRFDRLRNAVKIRGRYPDFAQTVSESMAQESLLLFRHVAWHDRDFREFFHADYTFVDDFLTTLYGMAEPEKPFVRTAFPTGSPRGGILGHGTFLAQTGKPDSTSPTERGLFIREHFLCQTIPPPPPGVNASLPPLVLGAEPMTIRESMEKLHASERSCASCHKLVDPIGYGFEHFNTVGAYRDTEEVRIEPTPQQKRDGRKTETHELPIDSTGYIAGISDSRFETPREAGRILAESRVCQRCVVKQLFRFIYGRHENRADEELIDRAYNRFQQSEFRFRELILALVVTEEFLGTSWR